MPLRFILASVSRRTLSGAPVNLSSAPGSSFGLAQGFLACAAHFLSWKMPCEFQNAEFLLIN